MFVPQLCHSSNRIESGVLAECVGNDLQGLGKALEAVGVGARQCVCIEHKLPRDLCLGGSASGNQEPFLHQAADDAERVMERSKTKIS